MEFQINTYTGVGPIMFGDSRESVRTKLQSPFKPFRKEGDCDAFNALGIHIHYDPSHCVEAVEFFKPAIAKFGDVDLLSLPYNQLIDIVRTLDEDVDEDESGFTSNKHGIGGYAPFKDEEPELNCEGVIAFREGYYSM